MAFKVLNRIYDSDINLIVYNHYCINTLHSRFDFMNNSTQLNSTQLADYVAQRFFVKRFFGDSLTVSVSESFFAAAGKAVA